MRYQVANCYAGDVSVGIAFVTWTVGTVRPLDQLLSILTSLFVAAMEISSVVLEMG